MVDNGTPLKLGGTRQRALLALLLTRPNEVARPTGWSTSSGASRRRTASKTVQYYVSGSGSCSARTGSTRAPGYALRVDRAELASHGASRSSGEALPALCMRRSELWRGPPLADFAYEPFLRPSRPPRGAPAGRNRARIEGDLESGPHAALVGELEAWSHEHPTRERLRGQLMLALYRVGQTVGVARRIPRVTNQARRASSASSRELHCKSSGRDAPAAPSLDTSATSVSAPPRRSILAVSFHSDSLDPLLTLAAALAGRPSRELIVAQLLDADADLAASTAALAAHREEIGARGVETRVAAYRSTTAGQDAVLGSQSSRTWDLLLVDAPVPARPALRVTMSQPCSIRRPATSRCW